MRVVILLLSIILFSPQVLQAQSRVQPIPLPIRQSVAAPFLSPKGDELFFSIRNFPGNLGGEADPADLFKVQRNADGMPVSELSRVDVFNTTGEDRLYGISADIRCFYLPPQASSGPSPGMSLAVGGTTNLGARSADFRLIRVNDQEEAKEEGQFMDGLPAGLIQGDVWVSSNNQVLLMVASSREGNTDLHLAYRKDKATWEYVFSLPASINSPADEISPFLAADQLTLYFSSNRENPQEYKLYMSRRLNEGWEYWSEPVKLDDTINDAPINTHFQIAPDGNGVLLKARSLQDRSYMFQVQPDADFLPASVSRAEIYLPGVKKIRGSRIYELHLLSAESEALEGRAFVYRDQEQYAFFLRKDENYTLRLLNHKGEVLLEQAVKAGSASPVSLSLEWEE